MLTRRRCMHLFAAAGLYSAMPALTLAQAPGDKRLVVILLRGAMDGLDVVRPVGDAAYAKLRGGDDKTIGLDGFYGLHPGLAPVVPLFKSHEISFVHAVATPYRARSHFDGQDILEKGIGENKAGEAGWLNRLLGLMSHPEPSLAVDIGSGSDIILEGPNRHASWFPDLKVDLTTESAQFLKALYKGDPILEPSFEEVQQLAGGKVTSPDIDPGISPRELAQLAAQFLNQDARIAAFSITGWDTHVTQQGKMEAQLKRLSSTLIALKEGLGRNWQHTAVVMCSEFGRTAHFNGTKGTDHGTGGLAILAGGLLANGRGGQVITNRWPGLGDGQLYEDRDLLPTDDVRRYPAWLIASLFDIGPARVADIVFPSLDMGSDLKLI